MAGDETNRGGALLYRVASFLNANPDKLSAFFENADSLEVFANIYGMLKYDVQCIAVKIASRLIIRIARQIADTGYRSGKLKLVRGFSEEGDMDLDRSLEEHADAPDRNIQDSLFSFVRSKERRAFAMMFDHSYSMKGIKIVLAAITAATIGQHFKEDYAIIAFSRWVKVLKPVEQKVGPESTLEKLFHLRLTGDTDIRLALVTGLQHLSGFEIKTGLLLTDGAWNQGGDPRPIASQFNRLSVIGFPPAKQEQVRELALIGKGDFSFVENQSQIAEAILKCLK